MSEPRDQIPGWEGTLGPFPKDYRRPHVYARDVQSGAGNCVCGAAPRDRIHLAVREDTGGTTIRRLNRDALGQPSARDADIDDWRNDLLAQLPSRAAMLDVRELHEAAAATRDVLELLVEAVRATFPEVMEHELGSTLAAGVSLPEAMQIVKQKADRLLRLRVLVIELIEKGYGAALIPPPAKEGE